MNSFGLYINGSLEKHYEWCSYKLKIVMASSFFPSFNFFVLLFSIFIFSPRLIATDLFLNLALETWIKHRSSTVTLTTQKLPLLTPAFSLVYLQLQHHPWVWGWWWWWGVVLYYFLVGVRRRKNKHCFIVVSKAIADQASLGSKEVEKSWLQQVTCCLVTPSDL